MPILWVFVFFLGLSVGSFINSITLRYNTGEKVTRGRSRCFSCAKNLSWPELIPLFGFIFLRGRCKNCRSAISWQYPISELLTGILFLLFFYEWLKNYPENPGILVFFWIVTSILVAIILYDLRHKIIPDFFSYSFFLAAFLGNLLFFRIDLVNLLLGFIPALFLLSLWILSRGRWMGLGDAKLLAGGGMFLGFPGSIFAFLFSFWIGGAVGIFLLLSNSGATLKSEIPFGPFLVLGILLAFFFRDFLTLSFFIYG